VQLLPGERFAIMGGKRGKGWRFWGLIGPKKVASSDEFS
jgi:hypothetical protein